MSVSYASLSKNDVFLLGRDLDARRELNGLLGEQGMTLRYFQALDDLRSALRLGYPSAMVLSTALLPAGKPLGGLIDELLGDLPNNERPHLIFIAESHDMQLRLQALRAGAKGFYPAPALSRDIAEKIFELISPTPVRTRILVVEDDAAQAQHIALLLGKQDMEVRTELDALKVLDTMAKFRPDLVIMDLYMPGASGIELTAVIRDHDDYFDIPIIFLSAELNEAVQREALNVGADSFVQKPVKKDVLLAAIQHRIGLRRSQANRRAQISRRSVSSGLLHKDYFLQSLDRVIQDQSVKLPGMALLIVEIDKFHELGQGQGPGARNLFVSRLERALMRAMSNVEIGSVVAEGTYAVLAKRTSSDQVKAFAEDLRAMAGEVRARAEGGVVVGSVSIGLAGFDPMPDDSITMLSRAGKACQRARQDGGNRIEEWSPLVSPSTGESAVRVEALIKQALNADGFLLMYQPIVALHNQLNAARYEVQLRLRAFDGEMIPPRDFLPVAERAGLMDRVDRWVVQNALDVLVEQRLREFNLRLLIHQSVSTVAAKGWVMWFRSLLVARNLLDQLPVLQFQLQDVRTNHTAARAMFSFLQKNGIHVCIANVTDADEEVALIRQIRPALVRLAFHTVTQLSPDDLKSLITNLHACGCAVIAGGIEAPESIARVWSSGADLMLGNYVQIPHEQMDFRFALGFTPDAR